MNIITCLVFNRPYNISRVLFDHMIHNVKGKKYIMYPRLSEMHEKKLRYWFVKDGKRKRTPKVSPTVTTTKVVTPKIVIKGKVERGSHKREPAKKKSPPRLVDEVVIPPADVIQEGVDLMKVTLEDFLKKNEEANVENIAESLTKNVETESVKEKESDTEPEFDTSKPGVGKIKLKVKPQKKK
ncbi:hypothetical protein Hanom_Chr02g00168531 [Helianthus anomalus]